MTGVWGVDTCHHVGCVGDCLSELSTALSTIFLTRLISTNINNIVRATNSTTTTPLPSTTVVLARLILLHCIPAQPSWTDSCLYCRVTIHTCPSLYTHSALLKLTPLPSAVCGPGHQVLASMANEKKKKEEMEGIEPGAVLTPAEREYAMEPYDRYGRGIAILCSGLGYGVVSWVGGEVRLSSRPGERVVPGCHRCLGLMPDLPVLDVAA